MKKALITFTEQEVREKAEEYFLMYSRLDPRKEKHGRMYRDALEVREKGIGEVNLSALVSSYGPEAYSGNKIAVDGLEITCEAFSQIPDSNVKGVYIYLLTAGECYCSPDEAIIKRLYADIWGTSYVDAGRDFLEEVIKEDVEKNLGKQLGIGGYISAPISPGFFGMKTEESKSINEMLSGKDLGISVRENGVMLPLKTCSGMYLIVDDPAKLPAAECRNCIGSSGGCSLCKVMAGRKNRGRDHGGTDSR